MKKGQKGITLVALVITIIVMLILAAVTIALVLNQDGIIGHAKNAVTLTNQAQQDEGILANGIVTYNNNTLTIDNIVND